VRDISNDMFRVDEGWELLLLRGARVLPMGLHNFDQFPQHTAFEFQLDAVHGRL
jgi:hypothetical protein